MGQLDKLHKEEVLLLTSIVALSLELPDSLTSYVEAIGEIRRKFFRKGRTLRSRTKGYIDGHQIRATERYGSNNATR